MQYLLSFSALLLFGVAHAQVNTWLHLHSCNACFGPGLCINEMDNLSSNCTSCLQNSCESNLGLDTFATLGVACIQRVWNDPNKCQSVCPPWTIYDYVRSHRCSLCLLPCVGTLLDQGAGQCSIMASVPNDPCVSESKLPCGTCYRANKCFTPKEFDGLGGFCKGYLELKCPGLSNVSCVENAFAEPCSTCPRNSITDGRFQSCKLCMDQCETKKTCVSECKANVTTYPTGLSCTLCRAFCEINPTVPNCEATHCKCSSCDECYQTCSDLPGDHFNLFNPCKCLNDERFAPVVLEESDSRILGGTSSCEGDWPWMAYLFERGSNPFLGGVCGATLFNNKWLVTAAHCIETNDADLYSVVLGEYDFASTSGREVFRNVSRIEKHPFFDALTFDYDVAVIELEEEVTFNKHMQPLAIAAPGTPTDSTFPPTFAGNLCTTVGWGYTTSPGGSSSTILNQLSLRVTPRVLCEIQTLQGYDQGPVISSAPKFCAGSLPGEDTCQGDSGGPLFCVQPDGTYLLHGITSYGTQVCGQNGRPGIYTKVADVSTWINLCISSNLCSL